MVYQDDISTQIAEDQIALTIDAECAMCKRSQLLDLSWCSGQAYNISDIEYQCHHCNDRTQFFLSKVTKLDPDAEIKARYRYNNGGWMEKRVGLEAGAYDLGDLVPEDARLNIMKLYVKLKEQAKTARDENEFDDFGIDAVRPGEGFGTQYNVGGATGLGAIPPHNNGVGAAPPPPACRDTLGYSGAVPHQAGCFPPHAGGAFPPRAGGASHADAEPEDLVQACPIHGPGHESAEHCSANVPTEDVGNFEYHEAVCEL